jgi:hypothetical protein
MSAAASPTTSCRKTRNASTWLSYLKPKGNPRLHVTCCMYHVARCGRPLHTAQADEGPSLPRRNGRARRREGERAVARWRSIVPRQTPILLAAVGCGRPSRGAAAGLPTGLALVRGGSAGAGPGSGLLARGGAYPGRSGCGWYESFRNSVATRKYE